MPPHNRPPHAATPKSVDDGDHITSNVPKKPPSVCTLAFATSSPMKKSPVAAPPPTTLSATPISPPSSTLPPDPCPPPAASSSRIRSYAHASRPCTAKMACCWLHFLAALRAAAADRTAKLLRVPERLAMQSTVPTSPRSTSMFAIRLRTFEAAPLIQVGQCRKADTSSPSTSTPTPRGTLIEKK